MLRKMTSLAVLLGCLFILSVWMTLFRLHTDWDPDLHASILADRAYPGILYHRYVLTHAFWRHYPALCNPNQILPRHGSDWIEPDFLGWIFIVGTLIAIGRFKLKRSWLALSLLTVAVGAMWYGFCCWMVSSGGFKSGINGNAIRVAGWTLITGAILAGLDLVDRTKRRDGKAGS